MTEDIDTQMTMGANIHVKFLNLENYKIALQIWDFGGEQQFHFLLPAYAKGSSGGIFVFDITRYQSMKRIYEWLDLFQLGVQEEFKSIPMVMVGAKKDLEKRRSVSSRDAALFAKGNNCFDYIECSSVTGENVGVIFEDLTRVMLKNNGLI